MGTGVRVDPFRAFNFRVEIDELEVGSFSEVSGLSSEGDAVEYREGMDFPLTVRKLPGLRKYMNITLKRGYTTNRELWLWYRNIQNGVDDRRNGSIILMDEERNDVMRWSIENAWINKIEAPTFNASGNEVAMESVEIVHEGLTLED
jgi:phage tail-like protein